MRWIIWYVRSCFCSHEWKFEEGILRTVYEYKKFVDNTTIVSVTCTKCAYHKRYEKFQ